MNLFKKRKIGIKLALLLLVAFPSVSVAQTNTSPLYTPSSSTNVGITTGVNTTPGSNMQFNSNGTSPTTGTSATTAQQSGATAATAAQQLSQFNGPIQKSEVCTCQRANTKNPYNIITTVGGRQFIFEPGQSVLETGSLSMIGANAVGNYTPGVGRCYMNSNNSCQLYGNPQGQIIKVGVATNVGAQTGAGASALGGGSSLNNILGVGALLLGVGGLAAGALAGSGGGSGAGSSGVGSSGTGFTPQDVSVPVGMGAPAEDYLNDNGVEVAPNVNVDELSVDAIEDTIDLEDSTGAGVVIVGGNEELSNTYNSGESIVNIQKNDAINKAIIENASSVVRNSLGLSNVFIVQPSARIPAGQYYDEAKGTGVAHWRILFTR